MTRDAVRQVSVLLLAACLTMLPGRSARAEAPSVNLCSLAPFSGTRFPDVTYFLGVAIADTLHAGKGTVRASGDGGHWGAGRRRPVYGQVVEVDSLAGADAEVIGRAFHRRGSRRVLVVPWDYDPACNTTYWSGSARWADLGSVGFFTVHPRPQRLWVDGMPTFDAFSADLEPYPTAPFLRAGYRGTDALRTSPSLSPAEYMSLYAALPLFDMRTNSPGSTEALEAWAAAHPALRDRYPASDILRRAGIPTARPAAP